MKRRLLIFNVAVFAALSLFGGIGYCKDKNDKTCASLDGWGACEELQSPDAAVREAAVVPELRLENVAYKVRVATIITRDAIRGTTLKVVVHILRIKDSENSAVELEDCAAVPTRASLFADRLIVVGIALDLRGTFFDVVRLADSRADPLILCDRPALSSNGRRIAYESFCPSHPGRDGCPLYIRVKDVSSPGSEDHQVYPPRGVEDRIEEGEIHRADSPLLWSKDDTKIVFFDKTKFVIVDLSKSFEEPELTILPVELSNLTKPGVTIGQMPVERIRWEPPDQIKVVLRQDPYWSRRTFTLCIAESIAKGRVVGKPEIEPITTPYFLRCYLGIDVRGAPNAYNKEDTGIDRLENSDFRYGDWDGLVLDSKGKPVIQCSRDPFPGFYVSATALVDTSRGKSDPRRYVDSTKIPYIALQADRDSPVQLGDFAAVHSMKTGKTAFAIVANWGPHANSVESSVKLAQKLGIPSNPRDGGGSQGILTVVFPHSGNGEPRTLREIESEGKRLLKKHGGIEEFIDLTQFE